MSDHFVRWIPADPSFAPSADAVERTLGWLRAKLPGIMVGARQVLNVELVDCGSNLEEIRCDRCGAELEVAWWQAAMDRASVTAFTDRRVVVPCCGVHGALDTLRYTWPMGFARFVLEAKNPGTVPDENDAEIARELGTPVLRLFAHY